MKRAQPRHDNDCVAAVLASLLELPIDRVPDFWSPGGDQHLKVRAWLAKRGFHWYYADIEPRQLEPFRTEKIHRDSTWPPRGYWIGRVSRVEWLRDGSANHLVVMRDQRCVFNPSSTITAVHEPDVWLIGYFLLVPLDPAKLTKE